MDRPIRHENGGSYHAGFDKEMPGSRRGRRGRRLRTSCSRSRCWGSKMARCALALRPRAMCRSIAWKCGNASARRGPPRKVASPRIWAVRICPHTSVVNKLINLHPSPEKSQQRIVTMKPSKDIDTQNRGCKWRPRTCNDGGSSGPDRRPQSRLGRGVSGHPDVHPLLGQADRAVSPRIACPLPGGNRRRTGARAVLGGQDRRLGRRTDHRTKAGATR